MINFDFRVKMKGCSLSLKPGYRLAKKSKSFLQAVIHPRQQPIKTEHMYIEFAVGEKNKSFSNNKVIHIQ